MNELEYIGKLAFDYYLRNIERLNAKKQRAIARQSHHCDAYMGGFIGNDDAPYPCWHVAQSPSSHLPEWCDNCKYVQPYHLAYQKAAINARVAKYKRTIACKNMLAKGAKEE